MSNTTYGGKNGLTIKDLVTTGIFSALFLAFNIIGSMLFAPNPILTFLMPLSAALLTGPVYMLLIAKVPKRGPIIILGVLMGIIMFITGMYWMWSVFYIILAIIADIISSMGKFKNSKLNIIGFMIFSLNPIGSYMMLWINQQTYMEYLTGKGTEQAYMDTMLATMQDWMLPAMIIGTLICALISALVGKRLLKKQFEKAGITV